MRTERGAMPQHISAKIACALYRSMCRIRRAEEKIAELYPSGDIRCPVHLCIGQEAVPAAVCRALGPDDRVFCGHRSHGYYIARNEDLNAFFAELFGKLPGIDKGRAGSQHFCASSPGFFTSSAILAGSIPIAVGSALAARLQGLPRISVVDFGDGAIEEGVFFESLNFASLRRLPVIFVCQNNLYATHAHVRLRHAGGSICDKAAVFGIPARTVDGNDVLSVYRAFCNAASRARQGKGPSLLECMTYRWREHVGYKYDYDIGYRSKAELIRWQRRCPLNKCESYLIRNGLMDRKGISGLNRRIKHELDRAAAFAAGAAVPAHGELTAGVFAPGKA